MLDKFSFLKQKISKENAPLIIGGAVVGILAFWLLIKIFSPLVKSTCKFILSSGPQTYQEREARPVECTVVKKGSISRRVVTVGRLKANNEVTLKSEVHGRIVEIPVKEGSEVQKGDILIKFDDQDTQASLKQYKAELSASEAELKRIAQLHSKNIQSTKQLDDTQAKRDIAAAKVEEAEATLSKKTIVAPFSGTIGLIHVSEGAYVQAGNDIASLVDNTPIRLDFKVPEKYIRDVGPGQIAEVKVDGFPKDIFQFIVTAVNSKVDEQSHSLSVRASNGNEENLLKAGLFCRVSLIIGDKHDAKLIPETSLSRTGEAEFVWTITKGKAARTRVVSGTRENGQVEIVSGLRNGHVVVTSGQMALAEGTKVKITNIKGLDQEDKKKESGSEETSESENASDDNSAKAEDPASQPSQEDKKQAENENSASANSQAQEPSSPSQQAQEASGTDSK